MNAQRKSTSGRCLLYPPGPEPDHGTLAALEGLAAAPLSDVRGRDGCLDGLRPIVEMGIGEAVAGRAMTVKTRPGDNLAVHQAAEFVQDGDFLVIDAGGATDRAVVGFNTCSYLRSRGAVAIALNGVIRDLAEVRTLGLPIFCLGTTFVAPLKSGPGEIRGPLAIGGTIVRQGDYVIGDADGVLVVPEARGKEVAETARRRVEAEGATAQAIQDGTLDRGWLAEAVELVTVDPDGNAVG